MSREMYGCNAGGRLSSTQRWIGPGWATNPCRHGYSFKTEEFDLRGGVPSSVGGPGRWSSKVASGILAKRRTVRIWYMFQHKAAMLTQQLDLGHAELVATANDQ
jgi:hypothetical protein